MIARLRETYTEHELDAFIEEWNALCDARAKNPFMSTRSRSFYLRPESKIVDTEYFTAREHAVKILTYNGRKVKRSLSEALLA